MRISYVNGRFVPHAKATVHIEDRGYQFSDGIYEYVAFYNGVLLDGGLHFNRLERSLKELGIAMPLSRKALEQAVATLIKRNKMKDGGLYVQVSRGVAKRDHAFPKDIKSSLVMTVCPPKTPAPDVVKNGAKVITTADIRWGRCDIKTVSLLANVLAKQQAVEAGAREAILIRENGVVSEGAVSNAYIVTKSGVLMTHPANQHILAGVTRNVVLRLAKKAGIKVAEKSFKLADLRAASEVFITSTSINVLPVTLIDGKKVGSGKPGPVTQKLQALYNIYVFKQTGKKL